MPGDYTLDQREFYEDCREDGGKITIVRTTTSDLDSSDPDSNEVDPSLWRGSSDAAIEFEHFAIFSQSNTDKVLVCYIPAYKIDFAITKEMFIKAENLSLFVYAIEEVQPFSVDGNTIIYYLCFCTANPR